MIYIIEIAEMCNVSLIMGQLLFVSVFSLILIITLSKHYMETPAEGDVAINSMTLSGLAMKG
jgi:uncharacterized membrane protein (DUF485 family)